jgi:hypothetical protein
MSAGISIGSGMAAPVSDAPQSPQNFLPSGFEA